MSRRNVAALVATLLGLGATAVLLNPECAFGGGMGGHYRACTCLGHEWVVFDHTAADGPRRTRCFGLVTQKTCFRHQGGAVEPCPRPAP